MKVFYASMGILNTYRDFKNFEPHYEKWYENQKIKDNKVKFVVEKQAVTDFAKKEQERAKVLVNMLTSLDEYAQTKAEDVDSTSQTLLYVVVGALSATGTFIGKKLSSVIKNQKLAKIVSPVIGLGFAISAFLPVARKTVENQVRANRMARFDGLNDKLFHINNFAILTEEQKKEVKKLADKIPDNTINNQNSIINRVNIFNSISVFNELTMKRGEYAYLKKKFDEKKEDDEKRVKQVKFSEEEIQQSKKDQKLFCKILKNVDIEAHYPLERTERFTNVAYSAMFMGGVLEYLVSDGILNLFKIKNKIARPVLAWGLPVLTVMSLNKQIANFTNDAIKSVRHKKMQEFINDINNFKDCDEKEVNKINADVKPQPKTRFIDFVKQTFQAMKDYEKYENTKRIEEKKFDIAVQNIELTEKQKKDAELLKRNSQLVQNTLDDQTQKYDVATETLTESITIPVDILSPLLGTFAAGKIYQAISPKNKSGTLFKGIGMLISFIPAAMSEIYFVTQQRSAKRCASLIAHNSLLNSNKFLDPKDKKNEYSDPIQRWAFNSKNTIEKKYI